MRHARQRTRTTKSHPNRPQQTEDVTITEDASTEDTDSPKNKLQRKRRRKNAEQPTWREVSQYVPQDQTVEGIAGGGVRQRAAYKLEATLKKIETLRLLLESEGDNFRRITCGW